MRNEERRLLGLILVIALLATGQGCGSAAMDGESGTAPHAPGAQGPDPDQERDSNAGSDQERDGELAPVSDLEPELIMLSGHEEQPIWGTGENDMFIGGGDGLLAHFDGTGWRPFVLDPDFSYQDIVSIFGFSSTDVYAGTAYGTLLHYDGETWSPEEIPSTSSIYDIWGASADDVYALASGGLMHFDGDVWTRTETGLPNDARWTKISGSGTEHLVLLGRDRERPFAPRFAHYDGAEWTEHAVPVDDRLRDVWSAGPNDTFVVGQEGAILHFDGETLSVMRNSNGSALHTVWGTSASEAFAGGEGYMLRFDGDSWRSMTAPANPDENFTQRFQALFGFGGNRLYTTGNGLHRFDGDSWNTELSHALTVNKIWASSPDDVLFVGTATHRYDGFSVEPEDFGGLATPSLRSAWGTGNRIYAAGTGGDIFLYDGQNWGKMVSNTSTTFFDITGTAEDDVFAVGYDGVIMHFNGAAWGGMVSGTQAHLRGVWAAGPDDVYAVGYESTVLHYDGNEWSTLFSGDKYYWHVTGFDSEHIVTPHSSDGVYFSDGISWRAEQAELGDVNSYIQAVHGTSPDNMYASGFAGLSHYDGETWTHVSPIRPGGTPALFAVGPREVYTAGRQGVYRYTVPSR